MEEGVQQLAEHERAHLGVDAVSHGLPTARFLSFEGL